MDQEYNKQRKRQQLEGGERGKDVIQESQIPTGSVSLPKIKDDIHPLGRGGWGGSEEQIK